MGKRPRQRWCHCLLLVVRYGEASAARYATNLVIQNNRRLISFLAHDVMRRYKVWQFEDKFLRDGLKALWVATERFELGRDARFSTYAFKGIRWAIMSRLQAEARKAKWREENREKITLHFKEFFWDREPDGNEEEIFNVLSRPYYEEVVNAARDVLSSRDQKILWDRHVESEKLEEIGTRHNLGKAGVSMAVLSSLKKLKRYMAKKRITPETLGLRSF